MRRSSLSSVSGGVDDVDLRLPQHPVAEAGTATAADGDARYIQRAVGFAAYREFGFMDDEARQAWFHERDAEPGQARENAVQGQCRPALLVVNLYVAQAQARIETVPVGAYACYGDLLADGGADALLDLRFVFVDVRQHDVAHGQHGRGEHDDDRPQRK